MIPPGELAARIEAAAWEAQHSDDPEKALEDIKNFLIENLPSIVYYLRVAYHAS